MKSKTMKKFLVENYILIFIYTIISVLIAYLIGYLVVTKLMSSDEINLALEAEDIYQSDLTKINSKDVESLNGWIELLNANKEVVQIIGTKQDDILIYNEDQLISSWRYNTNNLAQYPYLYSIYITPNESDPIRYCLVKIPREFMQLVPSFTSSKLPRAYILIRYIGWPLIISISLFFFVIGLSFFSKRVSNHIQRPLNELQQAMDNISTGNYEYHINYDALDELNEVKNGFNQMSVELNRIAHEKDVVSKSKERMLVNIAHDLKTPITTISGFSYALYNEDIRDEAGKKNAIELIYNKSILMDQMIQSLFQLSKLQDVGFPLNKIKVDLSEWLRQLISKHYNYLLEKGFLLELDIPDYPIWQAIDEKYFARALMNIINNSTKYNPEGTTIFISLCEDSNIVTINLADNGIGIPVDEQLELFKPFHRSQKATSSGSGLGLSISREIILKHNGNIQMIEDDRYSTNFEITLMSY